MQFELLDPRRDIDPVTFQSDKIGQVLPAPLEQVNCPQSTVGYPILQPAIQHLRIGTPTVVELESHVGIRSN